jgi:4-diphosphocytidyl-2-C-methyl-D-erythritol kinase
MRRAQAFAKINLALVVGPLRGDGKHEVATVLQKIDLADTLELEPATQLSVVGFEEDTLVRAALGALADVAGAPPHWRARIKKRIPVGAGLGGGSSDAAAALVLANSDLPEPLSFQALHEIAAALGADVPFFLCEGAQLGTGDGTALESVVLPHDYVVVLVLPDAHAKDSTAAVYRAFDDRGGAEGFEARRAELLVAIGAVEHARGLARLPRNDLASSPIAEQLLELGALRADVSGAGPTVYGLFSAEDDAQHALVGLRRTGQTWLVRPVRAGEQAGVAR